MSTEPTSPQPGDDATTAFEKARTYEPFQDGSDGGTSDDGSPASPPRGIRVGTIVWGIIVALFGAAVLAWGQGLRFDVQLAAIGVLAAAGLLLVASAVNRNRGKA